MTATPDNQWPRFQVFHQERPDQPYTNAGTVHAPDPEMALQNARDVFVRRPDCSGLWVAPADRIASMTAEQFQAAGPGEYGEGAGQSETYLVFEKRKQIGAHEYRGEVTARSATEALQRAAAAAEQPVLVWWVVPKRLVASTEDGERDSLFESARTKEYRGPEPYRTTTLMRELRQRAGEEG